MDLIVSTEFAFDVVRLVFFIACACLALNVYARYVQTGWLVRIAAKRFTVVLLLTLLVVGIKIFEDVLAKESGPVDEALLWFIRQHTPPALLGFFGTITLSGAGIFLAPVTLVLTGLLLIARQRRAAVLLAASMACGWLLTYGIKAAVSRPRPDLWSSAWYWGASFPSGHTVSTAAFATAVTICAAKIWPNSRYFTLPLGFVWVTLVGLSRLVLGVHWPTDVLAAICLGVLIPMAVSLLQDAGLRPPASTARES